MIFTETELSGSFVVELEYANDERGYFARTFCRKEFAAHGLDVSIVQCNLSYNRKKGTLRGMHYQVAPHAEAKLVACSRGAIYDVIVDLRKGSATYGRWFAIELHSDDRRRRMLYVPEGFAHGFQTLEDDTEVFYQMSHFFVQDSARGVRWDDPAFAIRWPEDQRTISERDKSYPDFDGRP